MRNVRIIFLKELRAYFESPIAYIFIIMFLLLSGAYFVSNLFLQNVSSLGTFFEAAPVLMLFFAPAITMRLISEERRMGTYETLGTKPLKHGEIVVGKFLAAWVLITAALVPTLVYAGTIAALGTVDSGPLLGGYLGLVLLGGAFVAIGTFSSTLSDNQIVALIIGFVLTTLLFMLDKILMYLPISLVSTVEYLGVGHHFSSLARGVLDSRDIVYYGSVIVMFVLLAAVFSARENRQSVLNWREQRSAQGLVRILLVLAALVLVNLFSVGVFARIDLTDSKIYTLSDVTKNLLGSLDDHVVVRAYFSSELPPPYHNHRRSVQELLEEYRAYSGGRFNYQFVNPAGEQDVEQAALTEGVTPIQVKVIKNDKFQTEKAYVGLAMTYADRRAAIPFLSSVERLEYELTGAIKNMKSARVKQVAILTDQGGAPVESMSAFRLALEKSFAVTTFSLADRVPVPAEVSALVVVGPRRKFEEQEKFILDQYLMRGGKVAFFVDAMAATPDGQSAAPVDLNLEDMFDAYGWILNTDLVADARCANISPGLAGTRSPFSAELPYQYFPIAADFNPENVVVANLPPVTFRYVSSVDTRLAAIRGATSTVAVTSSSRSKRMTGDRIDVDPTHMIPSETLNDGHVPLAAMIEGSFKSLYAKRHDIESFSGFGELVSSYKANGRPTRVVVVGDGDFALDGVQNGNANVTFASNLVDWLVDDIGMTSVRNRDLSPKPLSEVTEGTRTFGKYVNFAGPPGLVVLAGLVSLALKGARRRKHKNSF